MSIVSVFAVSRQSLRLSNVGDVDVSAVQLEGGMNETRIVHELDYPMVGEIKSSDTGDRVA